MTNQALPGRRLSLILPAYNEAAGIANAVAEADVALQQLTDDYEILVVDDGSSDETAAIVANAIRSNPRVRLLRHERNQGYGRALRTGFEAAQKELVAFTDADCQFHLEDLERLLPLTDGAPIAVGYRIDRQDPWQRRFYSWGYNQVVRGLLGTGVRDCDCALKVFRRETLPALLPETNGFFVNAEILTKARQQEFAVGEAGVRHRPRVRGSSKVSLFDVPRVLSRLLPFWWSRVLFAQSSNVKCQTSNVQDQMSNVKCSRSNVKCQKLNVKSRSNGTWNVGPLTFDFGHLTLDLGFLAVVVVAAMLFFSKLNCPLQEPEEPRYAEIPRQMLAEGSFALPMLHGLPYYDKPPLLYWLVMGSYELFGSMIGLRGRSRVWPAFCACS